MSHVGSLRTYSSAGGDADIRGAKVYGQNDEKLGEIIDVVFDHEGGDIRYVVVESDGWLHSREFLVPTEELELLGDETDSGNERFKVSLDKKQIERLPAYDAGHLEKERWNDYEQAYKQAWTEDPVLHREGSSHAITPTPAEMPVPASPTGLKIPPEPFQPRGIESSLNSSGASNITLTPVTSTMDTRYTGASVGRPVGTHGIGNLREEVSPGTRTTAETDSSKTFDKDAAARRLGRRWTTFQDYLRANRDKIAASCQSCSGEKKVA